MVTRPHVQESMYLNKERKEKIHNEEDEQQIKNLSYLTNDKIPARDRALSSPFTFF